MKSLYNIYESILDDIETAMDNGTNDIIIDMIFNKDLNKRRQGFNQLRLLVESHHSKQHKTTAKMKNSDSYFIQFTKSFKIKNGEIIDELMDYISYIQICKRTESSYRTVCINTSDNRLGNKITIFELKWDYTRANFNPKASNTKLYEVPEELNNLFRQIQMEAYNHR